MNNCIVKTKVNGHLDPSYVYEYWTHMMVTKSDKKTDKATFKNIMPGIILNTLFSPYFIQYKCSLQLKNCQIYRIKKVGWRRWQQIEVAWDPNYTKY